MTAKNCADCNRIFSYNPPVNYPDTRKYCDDCSAARKASYEAAQNKPKIMVPQKPVTAPVQKPINTPVNKGTGDVAPHKSDERDGSSPSLQECIHTGLKDGWSNITKNINENPDSLEIGTPSKGGAIKIYGDFDEPEAFIVKFTNAKKVRDEANRLLSLE
ncbi:MAG: hypothetical protein AAB355_00245 [Patescibacteria group bacterium]